MEQNAGNGDIFLNFNSSFGDEWSYFPYQFSRIIPNLPFPPPNLLVYPSTPIPAGHQLLPRGLHVDGGAMLFSGGHFHHRYFRPMVHQIHHVTSAPPPMILGGNVPFLGDEQLQSLINFPGNGMIGGSLWYPPQHRQSTAQYFRGYSTTYMSPFTANIPQMTIMEQESLHPSRPRFDVDNMPYEAMLALQEQMGDVSSGIREEDILRNLRQLRYEMSEEESEQKDLCCICLADFCDGDAIAKINCLHMFHYDCIAQWLKRKNSCPSCRGEALSF